MMHALLLIVDIQNDFLPGGSLGVHEGDKVIPVINALIEHFDHVIATKDWHPANHVSFLEQHTETPGLKNILIEGRPQELWPTHCVQNSYGAALSSKLHTSKIERIFYKGVDAQIDSYSAFFDNAHQRSTGLAEYLKKNNFEEIFVTGLATDYCVKASVEDAIKLGFQVTVILDGCCGIDLNPGDTKNALHHMQKLGARLITSSTLFSQF